MRSLDRIFASVPVAAAIVVAALGVHRMPSIPPRGFAVVLVVAGLLATILLPLRHHVLRWIAVLLAAAGACFAAADAGMAQRIAAAQEGRDYVVVGRVASMPIVAERSTRFLFDIDDCVDAVPDCPRNRRVRLGWHSFGERSKPMPVEAPVTTAAGIVGRSIDADQLGSEAGIGGRWHQGESPPLADRKEAAQVLADPAVGQGDHGVAHGGQAKQAGMIAETLCRLGFCNGLLGRAGKAGDAHQRLVCPFRRTVCAGLKNRFVEPDVADLELGGVDADSESPRPRIYVIAGEGTLSSPVKIAVGVECEGMGGYGATSSYRIHHLCRQLAPVQSHLLLPCRPNPVQDLPQHRRGRYRRKAKVGREPCA